MSCLLTKAFSALFLSPVIFAYLFASAFTPSSKFILIAKSQLDLSAAPSDNMSTPTLSILSSLVDAARHGSETIYHLADEARSGNVQFKEEGEARSAMTIADTAAQKVIVSSLLSKYPKLNIVGEEDEPIEIDIGSKKELNDTMLEGVGFYLPGFMKENDLKRPPEVLQLDEIVVYVDPLDGTREFVEGRLSNVQCLIGLCWRGRPLMGAVGLPFGMSEDQESTEVVFGLVGKGIGKLRYKKNDSKFYESCQMPEVKKYNAGDGISILSGDSLSVIPSIEVAQKVFSQSGITRHLAGGCGNKLLRQTQGVTFALQHTKSSLWDTAAPSSVLTAVGGKVTDYFGFPLIYGTSTLVNQLGVVSSGPGANKEHDRLTKAYRGEKRLLSVLSKFGHSSDDGSEQCVDIVRGLDGHPLNVDYFADHLGIRADSYSCPENEAVRGVMSNAARIHLHPSKDTIFYKRIDFSHLDHAKAKLRSAPHKLTRDVNSYEVETSFLASKACRSVIEKTGVRIPRCYDAILEPDHENAIESKFSLLLEDFSPLDGWYQEWLLRSEEECHASLTTLAKIHAYFWTGSDFWKDEEAAEELETSVWKSGGYVQPQMQTLNQCSNVAAGWAKNKMNCKDALESLEFWDTLGERLQSVAHDCGRLAHPFAKDGPSDKYAKYKTFTHGDPKQANFFFKQHESALQVGLIDFQWSGFGLAATDIAHFLQAAVHADRLVDSGEASLLRFYYGKLQQYLIEYGAYKSTEAVNANYSYETFIQQYETATLDLCRLVTAYAWTRFEQVEDSDVAGKERTMNKNSYNKNIKNVVWLMSRCNEILKSRDL